MSLNAPEQTAVKNASSLRVAIVAARYNPEFADALLASVTAFLGEAGIREARVIRVPGSNELPAAAQHAAGGGPRPDVIIALGVIIRGGTLHYELVARSASEGLQRVALDERVPVINGVIVAENEAQAAERCAGKISRGAEFAAAAIEMAALVKDGG
ncbi:MAG: 6,7-dimethyl-8-ribityllumazine synthase [Opitutaceae bacterium]|jgi:6,7-dimethyl-8-ribityllumazine synthase|nr:6,7-dimethyl-8-ribityllumazine synthase [Opitutaceae bacterium]